MKLLLAVLLFIVGLFFVLGQVNKTNLTEEDVYDTVIEKPTSRYWDSDVNDELERLSYEDRTLVYEFMEEYDRLYRDYYQGVITFGDAIFYQKLTGNVPVQQSEELALSDTVRKQDKVIESLRAQNENYQRAYENALRAQHSNQPQTISIQPDNSVPTRSYSLSRQESAPVTEKVDKRAVYRNYGVYELEEQLKRSRALDRQDPKWGMYQSDSPPTERIRRLLLEAREAADRSMR